MEIQFHRNGPLPPWRGEVSLLGTISWRVAFCKSNAKQKTSSQAYARSLVTKEATQLAIFHLSAKIISRGKGQSAIASAAYRSGDKLHDERYDETQDYTNKRFIEHSEIQLPENAPKEYKNRETLWNSVEKAERAKNAQLAREIELALPREITPEQRIQLVHDYVQQTFVDKGMVADWSIHNPQPDKDNPEKPVNPHAHIMLTMRSLRSNGSWAPKKTSHYELDENGQKVPVIDSETGKQKLGKRNQKIWKRVMTPTNDWNNPKNVEKWRSEWAKACNKYLAPDHQIDHRSYERQGIDRIPTEHEGHYAQKLERKHPGSSWKVARNNEIREQNRLMALLLQQWRKIEKAINQLKQKIAKAKNFEEERINERLRSLAEGLYDGRRMEKEVGDKQRAEHEFTSSDTDALIRQTEAQRSAEATQQRHADLERASREAKRSGQGHSRKQPSKAPERPINPQYSINKGRGREI